MIFVKDLSGKFALYKNLPDMLDDYPHLATEERNGRRYSNKIEYQITRLNKPFINEEIEIYRVKKPPK